MPSLYKTHGLVGSLLSSSLLGLALGVVWPSVAQAQAGSYFKVSSDQKCAYMRRPFTDRWTPIKSERKVPFGTFIDVRKKCNVKISYEGGGDNSWHSFEKILNFSEPITLSLQADLLRRVHMKRYFFEELPFSPESNDTKDTGVVYPYFKSAWDRLAVFVKNKTGNQESIAQLEKKAMVPTHMALRSSRLHVLYPVHGMSRLEYQYPAYLTLHWQRPADYAGYYRVAVWSHDEGSYEAAGYTKSDKYQIVLDEPGSYYMQISSPDYKFQSDPVLVHYLSLRKVRNPQLDADQTKITEIVPNFPPHNSTLMSEAPSTAITFTWSVYPSLSYKATLFIADVNEPSGQEKQVSLPDNAHYHSMALGPGTYRWWLHMTTTTAKISSDVQLLTIKKAGSQSIAALVQKHFDDEQEPAESVVFWYPSLPER